MRIYFARHGQSHANVKNVMDNRPPGPGLTDLGLEQARTLGKELASAGIEQVWGSTLRRAEETARYAAEELGLPYQTHAGLLEFDCGRLEGKGDEASWAEHWRVDALWASGQVDERTGGGESLREIEQRLWRFLEGLEEADTLVAGPACRVLQAAPPRQHRPGRGRAQYRWLEVPGLGRGCSLGQWHSRL